MRNKDGSRKVIKKGNICIAGATDDKWLKGKKEAPKLERLFH